MGKAARGLYKSHRPQRTRCFILRFGIWNSTGPVTPIWRYAYPSLAINWSSLFGLEGHIFCLLFSTPLFWFTSSHMEKSALGLEDGYVYLWPLFLSVYFSPLFPFCFVVFFIKFSNWRAKCLSLSRFTREKWNPRHINYSNLRQLSIMRKRPLCPLSILYPLSKTCLWKFIWLDEWVVVCELWLQVQMDRIMMDTCRYENR